MESDFSRTLYVDIKLGQMDRERHTPTRNKLSWVNTAAWLDLFWVNFVQIILIFAPYRLR